ncbi:MAG: hypothetical protein HGB02_08630 [Chlorobiaceae bacterium]|nr:hypothetical protein [Chlorobiaceae bacterium]
MKYIYTGPLSGVSLKEGGDVMLIPGAEVQLPEGNEYTGRLIRKGWLTAVKNLEPAPTEIEIEEKTKRRKP